MYQLRELRTIKRLTQKQLAKLSGVSSTMISTIETGKRIAELEEVKKLSAALNVDKTEIEWD